MESLKSSRPPPIMLKSSKSETLASCQHYVPSGVGGLVDIGRSELHSMCNAVLLKDLAESLEKDANQSRCRAHHFLSYNHGKKWTRCFSVGSSSFSRLAWRLSSLFSRRGFFSGDEFCPVPVPQRIEMLRKYSTLWWLGLAWHTFLHVSTAPCHAIQHEKIVMQCYLCQCLQTVALNSPSCEKIYFTDKKVFFVFGDFACMYHPGGHTQSPSQVRASCVENTACTMTGRGCCSHK